MAVDGLRDVRDCLDVFRDAQVGGTVQWYSIDDGRRHPKSSIFKKHGNYGHQ